MNAVRSTDDDELELGQLLAMLWRRRTLIAATIVVCVAIAAIYNLLAPKLYESEIMVELSKYSTSAYASPPSAARVIESLSFLQQVGRAAGVADPSVLKGRVSAGPVRDTPIVRIRMRAGSPEDARRLAEAAAEEFLALASVQILEQRQIIERRLAVVSADLADIRKVLDSSRQTLAQLPGGSSANDQRDVVRALTLNTIGISSGVYRGLMTEQRDLTGQLLELQLPALVASATLPAAPSTPRLAPSLAAAIILGALGASIGALALEAFGPAGQIAPSVHT